MLPNYDDIRRRIPEYPKWFDCHGVPRYDEFTPRDVPDIYADRAMLYLISCQNCDAQFKVAQQSHSRIDKAMRRQGVPETLDELKKIHYGDPPRHGCTGDTMNCWDLRVLEYWMLAEPTGAWCRVPEFEIELPDMRDEARNE